MDKLVIVFCLLFINLCSAQVITVVDEEEKRNINYRQVENFHDGAKITDSKIDGKLYIKRNGKFYKRVNFAELSPQDFGAKGDGKYKKSGDQNQLETGTDDSQAILKFITNRKKTPDFGSHYGGSSLYFPASIYKTYGNYGIDDSYTKLFGDGSGASILHFNQRNNLDIPAIRYGRKDDKDAWNSLLTGGGLEDIQLITDNNSIRNYAVLLDYVEYMNFDGVLISGFGKSAFKGSFWESNFNDVKIEATGTLQTADKNGVPETGIIDTDSGTSNKYRDASNNTLFNKLTFSSCGGTLLKLVANRNTTVNFNINGIYAETYAGDLGMADELPLIYMDRARLCTMMNGFFTINPTEKNRDGVFLRMDEVAQLSLSNLNISINPRKGFTTRMPRRLSSLAKIGESSSLDLSQVIISDPSDNIGHGLPSIPPLFVGRGNVQFNLLTLQTLEYRIGGSRRVTNIFDRNLKADGNLLMQYFDTNGNIKSRERKIVFDQGKLIYYSSEIPTNPETWEVGDRIQKNTIESLICTEAGSTGELGAIRGSGKIGSKRITLSSENTSLLKGDWILIGNSPAYNRIADIENTREIILEQPLKDAAVESLIRFKNPKWKQINCN